MFKKIKADYKAVLSRDPAARNGLEVILLYSGFHALLIHRFAHVLYNWKFFFLARLISQIAKFFTGVEIHPGAKIGPGLFIDHGMGVVIGETTIIGENVTIYQGATLGGTGKEKGKRHPTLGNNVVVGAGAKVLGSIIIGDDVRIGAGSVVLINVPADCTVVGVPGRIVKATASEIALLKQIDLQHNTMPDPILETLYKLQMRVAELEMREKNRESEHIKQDD